MKDYVVMVGMDWHSPGGMTAVVHQYQAGGLWNQWPIRYLASYRHDRIVDKIWMALRAYGTLFVWLLSGNVAVVHAHSAVYGSFWRKSGLLFMARLFRAKTIFHLHGGEFQHFYDECCGPVSRWFVRYFLRTVDVVAVLTERWVAVIRLVEPTCHPIVLPNPIGIAAYAPTPKLGKILFLGRLRDVKGVYELIEALPPLCVEFPHLELVMGGDGDPKPLIDLAKTLGVENHIKFLGWVDGDLKNIHFREAMIFVLPSYYEAQPVCVLEAMAQKVPLVATRVGGVPDMCTDGIDALLVEPKDVLGLSAALARLLRDPALRKQLTEAAFIRVQREYSYKKVLGRLGEVYSLFGVKPIGEFNDQIK